MDECAWAAIFGGRSAWLDREGGRGGCIVLAGAYTPPVIQI